MFDDLSHGITTTKDISMTTDQTPPTNIFCEMQLKQKTEFFCLFVKTPLHKDLRSLQHVTLKGHSSDLVLHIHNDFKRDLKKI